MRIKGSKEKYPSAFLQKKYEELLENPEPKRVTVAKNNGPASVAVASSRRESSSSDSASEVEDDARAGISSLDTRAKVVVKNGNVTLEEIKDEDDVIVIKDEDDVKQEEVKNPSILKTERS